jgi:tripartite motif-containing protein 71
MAGTPKKSKAPGSAKRPATAKTATQTIPRPAPPAAPAPAAGAGPKPWVLLALGVVAVLVVFEMTALLKGKVDRQRQLVQQSAFGSRGGQQRPESYNGAIALKTDAQDRLYLVDPDWSKVLVYDTRASKFLFAIDRTTAQKPTFAPTDVAADAQGNVYVLDRGNLEVAVFSATGEPLRRFPVPNASALAVSPKGEVLVSDNVKMQVVRYSPEGKELKRFGSPGSGRGQFNNPYRLTTDPAGNIYVVDMLNRRIQSFSPEGGFKHAWTLKFTPGIIVGITTWGKSVFINDFDNGFIWEYTPSGQLVGQITFVYPSNFALDSTGNFYLPSIEGIGRYTQVKKAAK